MTNLDVENSAVPDLSTMEEAASLSEIAYNHILQLIITGKLLPGSILQERQLAEMLSMSRTPVREALGRLESEALITRSHGRAPMVSDVSIEKFAYILDMRKLLEVEAAGRATGYIDQDKADIALAAIDTLLATKQPTAIQHWNVDELVHSTIADAAGNPLIASTIRDLRRRTHLFNSARIPTRLMPGASEHTKLMTAVMGSDPELSRQLMARHIDNVRDAIIDFMLGARRS